MKLSLKTSAIKSFGKTDENDIKSLEKVLNIRFPNDYKDFLLKTNGGSIPNDNTNEIVLKNIGKIINIDILYGVNTENSCFDIEYIKNSHQKFYKAEICQLLHSLDENEIPDNIDEYDSTCLNGFPLTVVESVQKPKPYKIIDGNHRIYFINKQDIKTYPVNVIHLSSLTEEMFINKFNFCIYLFYNLINYFNACNNLLSLIFEFKKCKKILISFNLL